MPASFGAPDFVDPLDLVDPARYARDGYPHALWARLRAEAPVARIEAPGFEPFWAVTKHADIQAISTQPHRFSSARDHARPAGAVMGTPPEMVVMLDPPRHGPMRRVANGALHPADGAGGPRRHRAHRGRRCSTAPRPASVPPRATSSSGSRHRCRSA